MLVSSFFIYLIQKEKSLWKREEEEEEGEREREREREKERKFFAVQFERKSFERKREEERRREKRGVLEDKKDASKSPSAKWNAEGCAVQHKAHAPPPPTSAPPPTATSLPWW